MGHANIPGYSGFLDVYDEAVDHFPSESVFVEVGVALGHSLAHLARRVIESKKKIEVWGVDPWEGNGRNGEQQEILGEKPTGDFPLFCRMMLEQAPEELELVRIVRAPSWRAAMMFRRVHFVLIDGAHDEQSVFDDIEEWYPKIARGGWIAGDDLSPKYQGVRAAVERVFGDNFEVRGTTWIVKKP